MEEIMFYMVACPRCRTWTIVEEVKTRGGDEEEDEHQGPQCGICDDELQCTSFCSSDIEAIDDTSLYKIWHQISGYIQDAAREDSLVDDERIRMSGTAEKVLQALAEAPSSAVTPKMMEYEFAVLLAHGEWSCLMPFRARSEEEAREKVVNSYSIITKYLPNSAEIISGIYLMRESEVEKE